MRGIHPSPVNFPHKWPVTRKYFHLMTSSWFNDIVLNFEFGSLDNPWFICKCNEIISLFSQNVIKVAISEKWVSLPNSISPVSLPTVFSKPQLAGFWISKYFEQYKVQRKFISRMVCFLCYLPPFQEWTSNWLSFDLNGALVFHRFPRAAIFIVS